MQVEEAPTHVHADSGGSIQAGDAVVIATNSPINRNCEHWQSMHGNQPTGHMQCLLRFQKVGNLMCYAIDGLDMRSRSQNSLQKITKQQDGYYTLGNEDLECLQGRAYHDLNQCSNSPLD
eukprot:1142609-Pelagomonas_calceolata.AAC.3